MKTKVKVEGILGINNDNSLRSFKEKGIGTWKPKAGGVGYGEVMESEAKERDTIFN